MAYKMQQSVPEAMNVKEEPEHVYKLYGEDAKDSWHICSKLFTSEKIG